MHRLLLPVARFGTGTFRAPIAAQAPHCGDGQEVFRSMAQLQQVTIGEDIYSHLHREHEKAASLFQRISELSGDEESRTRLFEHLRQDLLVHARAEEKVFYTALKQKALRDEAQDGVEEHAEIEELLEAVHAMATHDEDWSARFNELRELVQHHVSEEESEFFAAARQVFSEEEAQQMAKEMDAAERREKKLSRAEVR
jgi:hemerythrin-like domain-containing protein